MNQAALKAAIEQESKEGISAVELQKITNQNQSLEKDGDEKKEASAAEAQEKPAIEEFSEASNKHAIVKERFI